MNRIVNFIINGWRSSFKTKVCMIGSLVCAIVMIEAYLVAPFVSHVNTDLNNSCQGKSNEPVILNIQNSSIKQINRAANVAKKGGFINQIGGAAIYDFQHDKNCQVAPSIVIAQAIVESDWGQSSLYTKAHNAFGVKWHMGQRIDFNTREVYSGRSEMVNAYFQKYPNVSSSIQDHNHFLRNKFIGKNHNMNYKQDAHLLQANGYATDPHYAQTLISVIQMYHLYRYDEMATNK